MPIGFSLSFIRPAQSLGFTQSEILSDLPELRVDEMAACSTVEARAREQLAGIEDKMRELRRMEQALHQLVGACQARKLPSDRSILEELEER